MQKAKKMNKYRFFTATRSIVVGFMLIIAIGTCLLMLPFSTTDGKISFVDALFTSTSATCVTGLAIAPTVTTFTIFGQLVILALLQVGGMGFMAAASLLYLSFSKRVSLSSRLTMREDVGDGTVPHVKKLAGRIILMTMFFETLGAIILSGAFSRYMDAGQAIYNGIFHSVSAFCNAGFDIVALNPGFSFVPFNSDPLILLTTACLITVGGLGFLVVCDIWDKKRWRKLKLHTKIVLLTSLFLTFVGMMGIFATEFDNPLTMGNMSVGDKLLNSLFHSVTARTAGFNAVDTSLMETSTNVLTGILMFIGASPGSTGGGLKTTTLFILAITLVNVVRRKQYAVVAKQTIGAETIKKSFAVLLIAVTFMLGSSFAILAYEGTAFSLEQILFEQISAYATVGLSLGITANLSAFSKLIIILNMFIGRVGALTFLFSFSRKNSQIKDKIIYPEISIEI